MFRFNPRSRCNSVSRVLCVSVFDTWYVFSLSRDRGISWLPVIVGTYYMLPRLGLVWFSCLPGI